mgnify:CR=1 FL=1
MIKIELTNSEKTELSKIRNKTSDPRSEIALMVLLSSEGLNVSKISKTVHRHDHTVRLWLKRYIEKGLSGLNRKFSNGRPSVKRNLLISNLDKWLTESPFKYGYKTSEWTVSLIKDMFRKKTGESISEDTIERALKKADFSYRKAKKSVPLTAPSKEEKIEKVNNLIEEIKEFMKNDKVQIISLDETHLSSEPYLIRGWYKKNSTFDTYTPQEGELYDFWCLEYQGTRFFLEKFKKR